MGISIPQYRHNRYYLTLFRYLATRTINWVKTLYFRHLGTIIALTILFIGSSLSGQDTDLPELTIQNAAPQTIDLAPSEAELTESILSLENDNDNIDDETVDTVEGDNAVNTTTSTDVSEEYAQPTRLRDIDLDLFENRLKLFRGYEQWDTDQVGRWARVDYLISWRRGTNSPVLATTSELGTPIENAGVNGLPSTSNLMGSNTLNDESTPGIRVDFGKWLPGTDAALGARFYSMFDAGSTHSFDEGIVTRPFTFFAVLTSITP